VRALFTAVIHQSGDGVVYNLYNCIIVYRAVHGWFVLLRIFCMMMVTLIVILTFYLLYRMIVAVHSCRGWITGWIVV